MRTYLHIAEIVIWTLGSYLLVCVLTAPPCQRYGRMWNSTVRPPVPRAKTVYPDRSPDAFFLPLFPDLSLSHWRESPAVFTVRAESGTCPNLPKTCWLFLALSTTTLLATNLCRRMRNRIPPPPGFEVSVNA
jgi:hypothetical protein